MIGQHLDTTSWSGATARPARLIRLWLLLAEACARLTADGPVTDRLKQARRSLAQAARRVPATSPRERR